AVDVVAPPPAAAIAPGAPAAETPPAPAPGAPIGVMPPVATPPAPAAVTPLFEDVHDDSASTTEATAAETAPAWDARARRAACVAVRAGRDRRARSMDSAQYHGAGNRVPRPRAA